MPEPRPPGALQQTWGAASSLDGVASSDLAAELLARIHDQREPCDPTVAGALMMAIEKTLEPTS